MVNNSLILKSLDIQTCTVLIRKPSIILYICINYICTFNISLRMNDDGLTTSYSTTSVQIVLLSIHFKMNLQILSMTCMMKKKQIIIIMQHTHFVPNSMPREFQNLQN